MNLQIKLRTKVFLIYFLTLMSLFLWILAIQISNLDIGDFGLVHSLSPVFFAGLILLLISFILTLNWTKCNNLLCIQILILIIFLFLTPAIIEGTPRFRASYIVHGFAEYIIRNGNIDPEVIWYHNWPGTPILISMLLQLIGLGNNIFILKFFPFVLQFLSFFPIYVLLHEIFQDKNKIWIGIWIFYILNYVNQDYLSPQAIAYFFYLLLFMYIIKMENFYKQKRNEAYTTNYKLISILIVSSLVITHMLTSILIVAIFSLYSIFTSNYTNKKLFIRSTYLYTFIWIAWVIYGAVIYFNGNIRELVSKSFEFEIFISQNFEHRVSGSLAHLIVSKIMIYLSLLSIIIAVVGVILSLNKRDIIHTINKKIFIFGGAIILLIPLSSYGGEIIIRGYLFFIPILIIFIAQLYIKKLKYFIILYLLLMTPLHILIHYGNEKYDYLSDGELTSYEYFYEKVNSPYVTGGLPISSYKYIDKYKYTDYINLEWNETKYMPYKVFPDKPESYHTFVISRGDRIKFERYFNNSFYIYGFERNISLSRYYFEFYNNSDIQMYRTNSVWK